MNLKIGPEQIKWVKNVTRDGGNSIAYENILFSHKPVLNWFSTEGGKTNSKSLEAGDIVLLFQSPLVDQKATGVFITHLVEITDIDLVEDLESPDYRWARNVRVVAISNPILDIPNNHKFNFGGVNSGMACSIEYLKDYENSPIDQIQSKIWKLFNPLILNYLNRNPKSLRESKPWHFEDGVYRTNEVLERLNLEDLGFDLAGNPTGQNEKVFYVLNRILPLVESVIFKRRGLGQAWAVTGFNPLVWNFISKAGKEETFFEEGELKFLKSKGPNRVIPTQKKLDDLIAKTIARVNNLLGDKFGSQNSNQIDLSGSKVTQVPNLGEYGEIEGDTRILEHIKIEIRLRSSRIVQLSKENARLENRIRCECCGFDFYKEYGPVGEGYIECHHKNFISNGVRETRLEDLALVCSNCHRMLHRRNDEGTYLDVNELTEYFSSKIPY